MSIKAGLSIASDWLNGGGGGAMVM